MSVEKHGEKEKKKKICEGSSHRPTNEEEVKNWGKEKWFNRNSRGEINLNHGWDWEW